MEVHRKPLDGQYYYFSPQEPSTIAQRINDYFNAHREVIPPGMERINIVGDVAVLVWDQCPQFAIKIKVPTTNVMFALYYVNCEPYKVEENSLKLRVGVAEEIDQIIEKENLDLCYVPKKCVFDRGVIAEKLKLLSWDETDRRIKEMSPELQKIYIHQFWRIVYRTGNQDIPRNVLMLEDGRLAFFDTAPYGMTLERVEDLRPRATTNFLRETFFDHQLKLEEISRTVV